MRDRCVTESAEELFVCDRLWRARCTWRFLRPEAAQSEASTAEPVLSNSLHFFNSPTVSTEGTAFLRS